MDSQKDVNSLISWLALAIAVLALVLGWTAYNRAGGDLEEQIRREVQKAILEAEEARQNAEDASRAATGALMNESGKALDKTGAELQQESADVKSDSEDRGQ